MNPVQIIGGGIAGLSLGILLRQARVPVSVWEAGEYPRQKVCGEFINGQGIRILRSLQVEPALKKLGMERVTSVAFYSRHRAVLEDSLPLDGWAISRYGLDFCLAQEFQRLGGELKTQQRWQGDWDAPGVVRATGRRVQASAPGKWRWIGIKAHAAGVSLSSPLEVHWRPNGYVGLCRQSGGVVNVCGLFRMREPESNLRWQWQTYLRGPEPDTILASRLRNAQWHPETFVATAGFHVSRTFPKIDQCALGDALGMTAPMTGNGISAALESAALAAPTLSEYSLGKMDWAAAQQQIQARLCEQLQRRFRWGGRLEALLLQPLFFFLCERAVRVLPRLWRFFYFQTR